jgi:hypothetical protein
MAGPFIFISQSRIKEGELDNFKRGLREMAEFVEANEPRVIAFEKIMEFDQYLDTQSVDVYGVPNDAVLGMMKQMADQFSGSGMSLRVMSNPVGGFTRAD